jgi:hypothetical protein
MGHDQDSKNKTLEPDDFPIEAEQEALKTQGGEMIAEAKSEKLAEHIAERLNEHAYQEECDRWSA